MSAIGVDAPGVARRIGAMSAVSRQLEEPDGAGGVAGDDRVAVVATAA